MKTLTFGQQVVPPAQKYPGGQMVPEQIELPAGTHWLFRQSEAPSQQRPPQTEAPAAQHCSRVGGKRRA